uniref:Uncharacterized protein n=1 Tax=Opuntia streptacantha TaxID=393608 RepID=A0A7C9DXW4_OPUST
MVSRASRVNQPWKISMCCAFRISRFIKAWAFSISRFIWAWAFRISTFHWRCRVAKCQRTCSISWTNRTYRRGGYACRTKRIYWTCLLFIWLNDAPSGTLVICQLWLKSVRIGILRQEYDDEVAAFIRSFFFLN